MIYFHLLTELFDCAKEKPVLHESILELLYEHLSKYLPDAEDNAMGPPLLMDKCVQITPITAVLIVSILIFFWFVLAIKITTCKKELLI